MDEQQVDKDRFKLDYQKWPKERVLNIHLLDGDDKLVFFNNYNELKGNLGLDTCKIRSASVYVRFIDNPPRGVSGAYEMFGDYKGRLVEFQKPFDKVNRTDEKKRLLAISQDAKKKLSNARSLEKGAGKSSSSVPEQQGTAPVPESAGFLGEASLARYDGVSLFFGPEAIELNQSFELATKVTRHHYGGCRTLDEFTRLLDKAESVGANLVARGVAGKNLEGLYFLYAVDEGKLSYNAREFTLSGLRKKLLEKAPSA